MKIALAQIDTTVGALDANRALILETYRQAAEAGAELVVFPELTVTGYPPRDLLELPDFIARNLETLEALAAEMTGPGAVVGYVQPVATADLPPDAPDHLKGGKGLYNAAALIDGGRVVSRHFKTLLPTYDVFDEARHFDPGPAPRPAEFRGHRLGITICEDFWNNALYAPQRLYRRDPIDELMAQGCELMVHIAASPFSVGKRAIKAAMYRAVTAQRAVPLVQVNLVGGNDNLIFDGWSNVWDARGEAVVQAPEFAPALLYWDWQPASEPGAKPGADLGSSPAPARLDFDEIRRDGTASLYGALVLGIRDYMAKTGFKQALIGLSGGIDSALTAVLAADAIGPENVLGVSMPSRFSSGHSRDDAADLARRLGIRYETVAIEPMVAAFEQQLAPLFAGTPFGLAEENLQSRTRGNLLMTISNKFGHLVLTTGNKSEMAVGYCTLYGDMCGGLCVLGDVLKTQVYELSRWINRDGERIPHASIEKPPSAELRPDQLDTDSLPPYEVLDPIVAAYVEEQVGAGEIVARGYEEALVRRILRMIDRSEYKRQQAAPTLKVTMKAFGTGRRMPIARGWY